MTFRVVSTFGTKTLFPFFSLLACGYLLHALQCCPLVAISTSWEILKGAQTGNCVLLRRRFPRSRGFPPASVVPSQGSLSSSSSSSSTSSSPLDFSLASHLPPLPSIAHRSPLLNPTSPSPSSLSFPSFSSASSRLVTYQPARPPCSATSAPVSLCSLSSSSSSCTPFNPIPPYACHVCGKRFRKPGGLSAHEPYCFPSSPLDETQKGKAKKVQSPRAAIGCSSSFPSLAPHPPSLSSASLFTALEPAATVLETDITNYNRYQRDVVLLIIQPSAGSASIARLSPVRAHLQVPRRASESRSRLLPSKTTQRTGQPSGSNTLSSSSGTGTNVTVDLDSSSSRKSTSDDDGSDGTPSQTRYPCPHCLWVGSSGRGLALHTRRKHKEEADFSTPEGLTWEWVDCSGAHCETYTQGSETSVEGDFGGRHASRGLSSAQLSDMASAFLSSPKLCLRSPPRSGRKKRGCFVSANWLSSLLLKAKAGNMQDLFDDANKIGSRRRPGVSHRNDIALRERVLALAEEGQYGKACRALSSQGLHELSPAVVASLESKHPQNQPPFPCEQNYPSSPPSFSPEEILKALRGFPKGTAPGGSAMRVSHLLEAFPDMKGAHWDVVPPRPPLQSAGRW